MSQAARSTGTMPKGGSEGLPGSKRAGPSGRLSSRLMILCLLLAASALATLAVIAPLKRHASAEPVSKARFEYRVVDIDYPSAVKTKTWKELLAEEEGDAWRTMPRFQQAVLQSWGDRGWELVAVHVRNSRSTLLYLKRRVSSEESGK